jgi:2-dehydro-3-deoxygluconokinase
MTTIETSTAPGILGVRDRSATGYDVVALGEVMLRLDPGEGRIRTTRSFRAWEGGGEYNVARGLRRCFGRRTAVVTAFVDNEIGRLLEDLVLTGGVDQRWVSWVSHDGTGARARNGLNFTERGFGVRGAVGVSDRARSAASLLGPGDVDWDEVFADTRWLHTGGVFAALSTSTADLVVEAVTAARKHGVRVSYDLNYRPSLWEAHGGLDRAREVNRRVVGDVDVLLGNEEDFHACLGYDVGSVEELDQSRYERVIDSVHADFPGIAVVASTLRRAVTATCNDWGALAWSPSAGFVRATQRDGLEILDRVGGGDSFAAGLVHALLDGKTLQQAVEYGAAHGALAMTTPGDTSMATLRDVERLVGGGSARVER